MAQGPLPEGVFSLLDTDLYKLTMQCAVLKYFPDVCEYMALESRLFVLSDSCYLDVNYGFTNRTPQMKLRRAGYKWLLEQMNSMWNCIYYTGGPELMVHSFFRNCEYPSVAG